jgi:hypothetical protein
MVGDVNEGRWGGGWGGGGIEGGRRAGGPVGLQADRGPIVRPQIVSLICFPNII